MYSDGLQQWPAKCDPQRAAASATPELLSEMQILESHSRLSGLSSPGGRAWPSAS